jgi:hypothetical protein
MLISAGKHPAEDGEWEEEAAVATEEEEPSP